MTIHPAKGPPRSSVNSHRWLTQRDASDESASISPEDPGGLDKDAKKGRYVFPPGEFWVKGISIEMGQAGKAL
jgi:hypothetical protein